MEIILHGSTGAMGKAVAELVAGGKHTIAAFVSPEYPENTEKQYQKLADYAGPADCIIDFSNHAAAKDLTDYAAKRGIPLVIATTGYTEEEMELVKACAKKVPVFHSANMSLGVAAMADLTRQAAALFLDADIEIVEAHHNRKVDAPSGTALMLFNAVKESRPEAVANCGRAGEGKRTKEEIGISSLRMGNVVGIHEVHICTGTQTLTLKHEATTRAMLADGAVDAARFMEGKAKGLYNMENILG